MARIIDLGNGRGILKHYYSPYANLHFDLKPCAIRRFYSWGFLDRDEYFYWLDYLGCAPEQIKVFYALDVAGCKLEREDFYANLIRKGV